MNIAAGYSLSLGIGLLEVDDALKLFKPYIHLFNCRPQLLCLILRYFCKRFVFLKANTLFLLFLIKFLVIFFDSKKFCLNLYHLFLIEI